MSEAAQRLRNLAERIERERPRIEKLDFPAVMEQRQTLLGKCCEEAGMALCQAIDAGELKLPGEIRKVIDFERQNKLPRFGRVFTVVVQDWLPTARPGCGGPTMSYPDAHLDAVTIAPASMFFLRISRLLRILADVLDPPRTPADTIREWVNEVFRLKHVLLHATGDEGERFRSAPSVWAVNANHHVHEAVTAALRAADACGRLDRIQPLIRSALIAFRDFARLAPEIPLHSRDRVPRLLDSEPWQRLRSSIDDLKFAIQSLPTVAAAEQPHTQAAHDAGSMAQGDDHAEAIPSENDGPISVARTASGSVSLFGRHDSPVVNGTEKPTLTNAQYDVVLALLQTGEKGLTKDELDRKSQRGDARKILKRLSDADPDWQSVISFPGTTGKGYRII